MSLVRSEISLLGMRAEATHLWLALVALSLVLMGAGCILAPAGAQDGGAAPARESAIVGAGRSASCHAHTDCRVVADYCAGCDCLALHQQESLAACQREPVTCLVNPCEQEVARCVHGKCVTSSGALR